VRGLGEEVVYVESKWGKLGRFLHPHTVWAQPETTASFYRADRTGHALRQADDGDTADTE